jgi:hypothetical protein
MFFLHNYGGKWDAFLSCLQLGVLPRTYWYSLLYLLHGVCKLCLVTFMYFNKYSVMLYKGFAVTWFLSILLGQILGSFVVKLILHTIRNRELIDTSLKFWTWCVYHLRLHKFCNGWLENKAIRKKMIVLPVYCSFSRRTNGLL